MPALKVLLADDHQLLLAGVKRALEDAGDLEVVGEARTGSQVLPLIGRTNPDVVLLDMRVPGIDGFSCVERIRLRYPKVKVVVPSVSASPGQSHASLAHGASGYLVNSINPSTCLRQCARRSREPSTTRSEYPRRTTSRSTRCGGARTEAGAVATPFGTARTAQ